MQAYRGRVIAKKESYRETRMQRDRDRERRYRELLADRYVRRLVFNHTAIRTADIPQELVELYRVHLQLNRLLKEVRHEEHS
ncbi:Uncharacterised protein [Burkholderia pseudomallei]|nr:Uncharacterised protein [Burkholderia pseudomallei]CAJ8243224.1 Uncharacterised protein [Burkholderia pseudomallei]VBF29620.1 Uncharacterised protein [Burkholderia pseudomallei]